MSQPPYEAADLPPHLKDAEKDALLMEWVALIECMEVRLAELEAAISKSKKKTSNSPRPPSQVGPYCKGEPAPSSWPRVRPLAAAPNLRRMADTRLRYAAPSQERCRGVDFGSLCRATGPRPRPAQCPIRHQSR